MTALTANVDPRFDTAFPEACARIGCKPIDLLGVMFSESACSPAAHNREPGMVKDKATGELRPSLPSERYNAVGLIQFMPPSLVGLNWRDGYEAFKHLSASQQLPYVVAYFQPWQKDGAPWDSAGRLYQACFLPATLKSKRAPEDVLTGRGGPLGWAFEANKGFDANGDGVITISELTDAIFRNAKGPRWLELLERLGLEAPESDESTELGDAMSGGERKLDTYLRSIRGVQQALERLGFPVGEHGVDGFYGNDTREAVLAFQKEHEIKVDGRVGPETRRTLALALLTAA